MTTSPEAFGPYLVYERLGAGGMATVHRAVQTGIEGFQRPVALKRLLTQFAGDQEFVRGFVREARLASRLQHANIAQTYDLGRVDHTYYIAMELVDGVDLRHVLRHIAYSVGPMPVPVVLAIMTQVCDALDYAHTFADETGRPLGIVHRDVSPSNLLVGRDGVVKIIDFGIAKASSATLYTASGVLKGKFSYMAPESLDGHTDARSDLFAAGVVMYELLTARPLFKGATDFDTLELIKKKDVPPPSTIAPGIPPEVDRVVLTALAKNPTQRWQSAAILRQAIAALAAQPAMRATHLDAARWIEWALAQPARAYAWDEAPPAGEAADASLVEIEVSPGTQIGIAPPARGRPPTANPASPVLPPGKATLVAWQGGPGAPQPAAPAGGIGHAPTAAVPPVGGIGHAATQAVPIGHAATQAVPIGHAATQAVPAAAGIGHAATQAVPAAAGIGHAATQAVAIGHPAGHAATAAVPGHAAPAPTVIAHNADASTMLVEPLRPVLGTPSPAQAPANPLASPEYQAAAAAYNALEERVAQQATVISLPERGVAVPPSPAAAAAARGGGAGWIVLVVLLCAGAAVGGFFLVDALL